MKIPETLKIGAAQFRVSEKATLHNRDTNEGEKEGVLGLSNYGDRRIEIATSHRGETCPEDLIAHVFMHEIIHMIAEHGQIHPSEKQVNLISVGLLMTIRDNNLDFRSNQ